MRWPSINATAITAAVTGGALVVSAILPHGRVDDMSLCPISYIIGHECPFCGMSRGFVALTHLDVPGALEFNPGSPLIYVAFLYMFWSSFKALMNGNTMMPSVPKKLYYGWLVPTLFVFSYMFYLRVVKVWWL